MIRCDPVVTRHFLDHILSFSHRFLAFSGAMGRGGANWVADPLDVEHLVDFLYERRSRVGQGGNFDDTVMNEAAVHMASFGPPKKGDVKTAASCASKWIAVRPYMACLAACTDKNC